jgi:MFS superfamily sulfate permease-like transporter
VLVLDLSRVPDIEYSALQALMEGEKRAADLGIDTWLTGLNPGVLEVVRHAGIDQRLGPQRMPVNAREAITRYQARSSAASAGDLIDPSQPAPARASK